MSGELLKLTTYFGEHDRTEHQLLADALFALYGRERVWVSAMLRGIEGFGRHHLAHTELLLTLSEDLPIMSVALDAPERIEALLPRVLGLKRRGMVTLERARPLGGPLQGQPGLQLPADLADQAKLTIYLGRRQRVRGTPAFVAACELLRRHGMDGATVLLGVDGTLAGVRTRARLFNVNPDVPILVIAVGAVTAVRGAMAELHRVLERPPITVERVRVCRRAGVELSDPSPLPPVLAHDEPWAQKLTVHSTEDDRVDGRPLHRVLVEHLRRQRLAGATTLRGVWGFHDDLAPRGDRLLQLRRHAPVMTIAVDQPERIAEVFDEVARITGRAGLVTVETVPTRVFPSD